MRYKYTSLQTLALRILIVYFFFYQMILVAISGKLLYFILVAALALLGLSFLMHPAIHVTSSKLLWIAVLAISLVRNQGLKNQDYLWPLTFGVLILSFVFLTENSGWTQYYIRSLMLIGGIFLVATYFFYVFPGAYSLMHSFWGSYPAGTNGGATGYCAGLTNHYSANGIYLSAFTLMAGGLFITRKKGRIREENKKTKQLLFLFILGMIGILLTTKRAHILFTALAVTLSYFVFSQNREFSKFSKFLGGIIGLAAVYWFASLFIPALDTVFVRFANSDDISNGRFELWGRAWDLFLKNPVFGIGWLGYRFNSSWFTGGEYYVDCHNVFVQLLCESGVVGFLITFSAIMACYIGTYRTFKRYRKVLSVPQYQTLACSFTVQTFSILYDLTGNGLYDRMFFVYILACGAALAIQIDLARKGKNRYEVVRYRPHL